MKLISAKLCVVCEEIYQNSECCPACGCSQFLWLANIVNKEAKYFHDLLYLPNEKEYERVKEIIQKNFPEFNIYDASDDVHKFRLEIEGYPTKERIKNFYEFAQKEDFAKYSLKFSLNVNVV